MRLPRIVSALHGVRDGNIRQVKATAWPKGDYKIEILLDGVSAGTKDFTIK